MFLPPNHQENITPAFPQEQGGNVSQKLQLIQGLSKYSLYGFWFGLGVSIANISRLIPGFGIIYWGFMLSASGYLILIKPGNADEKMISMRRICGLALSLSVISFWDAIFAAMSMPVALGNIIFPAWMLGIVIVSGLLFLFGCAVFSTQRR